MQRYKRSYRGTLALAISTILTLPVIAQAAPYSDCNLRVLEPEVGANVPCAAKGFGWLNDFYIFFRDGPNADSPISDFLHAENTNLTDSKITLNSADPIPAINPVPAVFFNFNEETGARIGDQDARNYFTSVPSTAGAILFDFIDRDKNHAAPLKFFSERGTGDDEALAGALSDSLVAVPEPANWILSLTAGLVGLLGYGWRRKKRA